MRFMKFMDSLRLMKERTSIQGRISEFDGGKENARWVIRRYKNQRDADLQVEYTREEAVELFGVEQESHIKHNVLLKEGINAIWTLVAGTGGTQFNAANAYIGVGDSDTEAANTQTGLQAVTNKAYAGMVNGFPTYGTNEKVVFKSQFGASAGNFAWKEITVASGNSDAAVNMNRKVSNQGVKVEDQVWDVTLEISLS